MASDLGAGDSELPFIDVAPADNTTLVTCSVTAPNGTPSTVAMTGGALVPIAGTSPVEYTQRWTGATPVTYDQPGKWILHYTVTGAGEGAEDLEVYVVASPTAGGPTWTPGLSRVAAYVPHRTLARSTSSTIGSQDTYEMTFDATTIPDGVTVSRLIADGVDWITALVTPLNVKSQPAAALLSALWAAVSVERSWPDDATSLQRANDMEKRLDSMLTALVASNAIANGADGQGGGDYALDIVPMWSFPSADPRWDCSTYF